MIQVISDETKANQNSLKYTFIWTILIICQPQAGRYLRVTHIVGELCCVNFGVVPHFKAKEYYCYVALIWVKNMKCQVLSLYNTTVILRQFWGGATF